MIVRYSIIYGLVRKHMTRSQRWLIPMTFRHKVTQVRSVHGNKDSTIRGQFINKSGKHSRDLHRCHCASTMDLLICDDKQTSDAI